MIQHLLLADPLTLSEQPHGDDNYLAWVGFSLVRFVVPICRRPHDGGIIRIDRPVDGNLFSHIHAPRDPMFDIPD